jgi:hypothetical protein
MPHEEIPLYYLQVNQAEKCYELLQRGAAHASGKQGHKMDDILLARFYDGNGQRSPLANLLVDILNDSAEFESDSYSSPSSPSSSMMEGWA